MKASTFPALVALFATFLFVSATPLMEVRTDSVGGIQIEIHDKLTVISGETIMGSAGSHAWGPEVIGAHSSIWIAGIGMPDTPTGASAKTDITMQTFKYEGYNRGPDSAGGPTRIPVHGQVSCCLSPVSQEATCRKTNNLPL